MASHPAEVVPIVFVAIRTPRAHTCRRQILGQILRLSLFEEFDDWTRHRPNRAPSAPGDDGARCFQLTSRRAWGRIDPSVLRHGNVFR